MAQATAAMNTGGPNGGNNNHNNAAPANPFYGNLTPGYIPGSYGGEMVKEVW